MDVEGAVSGAEGTDWTAGQIAVVVANYFLMLGQDRSGAKLNKADLYRRLSPEVGRSVKSIEWKLRNVSAVLEKLGIAWIPGLVPAHNHQDALVEVRMEISLRVDPRLVIALAMWLGS